jgi:phage-related protein
MAFRVAEGFVEVTMDRKKYDAEKAKLAKESLDIKVLVKLDQAAAKAQLAALLQNTQLKVKVNPEMGAIGTYLTQLDRLTRDQQVTITPVMGNPDNYLRQLERLTRDQFITVTPRIKADQYLTQLDRLTRDRLIDIRANLVTGEARARLDNLTRNRRVRIDVDAQGLTGLAGLFSRIGSSSGSASGGLGLFSSRIGAILAATLPVVPSLASLGQAIISMGPAAAVAAPALASLASIIGTLKIGLSGVGGAFKAAFAPAAGGGGGGGADGMAKAIQAAERRVADSKRGVAQATEEAARRVQKANRDVGDAEQALAGAREQAADRSTRALQDVADAERRLADAQARSLRAQQDLEAARKEAAEGLEDLANRVADGKLQERADVLRLQEAEADLAVVRRTGSGATAEQTERAQLAYDQAVQALQEQRLENRRLAAEQEQASRAGVSGSERVRSAQEEVTQATRETDDATRELADAQKDSARTQKENAQDLAGAQRDLADAQQAAADAVIEGNDRVARSQEELARAQEDLAAASEKQAAAAAAGANAFADAMAKLAPSAREFVQAVIGLKPAWDALKLDVQQALFEGIGARLTTVARQVLPDLKAGLVGTASVLNQMGINALDAVDKLSKTGTLKAAFASINEGLNPLRRAPGDLLSMFTTLTAAAGPAFQRITTAIGQALGSFSAKLTAGLETGALTEKISAALDVAVQFGRLLFDVFGVVGNVMKAASAAGGDSLSILGQVFDSLKRITGSPEVQAGLQSLFRVFNTLAATVLPLVGQALIGLMPVFQTFGPPIEMLIRSLGTALQPVLAALQPVLLVAARAAGQLVTAALPLIDLAGDLAVGLLPILLPLLTGLATVFRQAQPAVIALANGLRTLAPVWAVLPGLIQPIVDMFTIMTGALLPVLTQLLTDLPLAELGQAFADIGTALAPVLAQLAVLLAEQLKIMLPILQPIIQAVTALANIFVNLLASYIQNIVVPALQTLTSFLKGDFASTWENAKRFVRGFIDFTIDLFVRLPGQLYDLIVYRLGPALWDATSQAWSNLKNAASAKIQSDFFPWVRDLRGQTVAALGDVDRWLFLAGRSIITGLVDGIRSGAGRVRDAINSVLSDARQYLPFSPAKVGPFSGKGWTLYSGRAIGDSLATGLRQRADVVRSAAGFLAGAAMPGLITPSIGTVSLAAPDATAGLSVGAVPTPLAAAPAVPSPVPTAVAGITIANLTVNIPPGSLDMASPADRRRIVDALIGDIKDGLRDYDRARGR